MLRIQIAIVLAVAEFGHKNWHGLSSQLESFVAITVEKKPNCE